MEEKKNEQVDEKQDCQELDDDALEDTSGGIGERTLPSFQGLMERSFPDFQEKRDFDKGLDVDAGNPDF